MRIPRGSVAGLFASLSLVLVAGGCEKKQEGIAVQQPAPTVETPPASEARAPEQPAAENQVSAAEFAAAVQKLPQPDRSFIEQASGANAAAVQFGKLAMERGSTERIRRLGSEMVDTHTRLSDDLRKSAAEEGVTLPLPAMTQAQTRRYLELSKKSGTDFDDDYLKAIREVQEQTIASFQKEAVHGHNASLSRFANESLPVLNERVRHVRREMKQM
jgi:putative membrane protein